MSCGYPLIYIDNKASGVTVPIMYKSTMLHTSVIGTCGAATAGLCGPKAKIEPCITEPAAALAAILNEAGITVV